MSTSSRRPGPRKQALVAEIGNDWIKLVQFEVARDGLVVSKMHLQKVAGSSGELSRTLAAAIRTNKFADLPAIACLSRQMVNIRMLDLPSIDPGEIADMVDLQSGKQTPYSKEEILCDHRIVGSVRPGYTKVMLVIVQRSLLRQQYAILRDAGLRIERMTVTAEGLINWARQEADAAGARILLDIDSGYTDFCVLSGGGVIFTRGIPVGGNELLRDPEACREKFGKEVQRSMDIFEAESGGIAPDRLLISGARIPTVAESLAGAVAIPVSAVDSLARIRKKPSEPDLADGEYRAVSLTALTGVAMAPDRLTFDLIPDVARMRNALEVRAKRLTTFVILVVAAMLSASFFATVKFGLQRNRLVALRREYLATQPAVESAERMQELVKVARDRRNRKFCPLTVLSEIQRVAGGDLHFDVVDIDREGERVSLAGMASTPREIRTLVNRLETSPLFENVRETGTMTLDPRMNRYKFEVVCGLEK